MSNRKIKQKQVILSSLKLYCNFLCISVSQPSVLYLSCLCSIWIKVILKLYKHDHSLVLIHNPPIRSKCVACTIRKLSIENQLRIHVINTDPTASNLQGDQLVSVFQFQKSTVNKIGKLIKNFMLIRERDRSLYWYSNRINLYKHY